MNREATDPRAPIQVVVVDDDAERSEKWAASVRAAEQRGAIEVHTISGADLVVLFWVLESRRAAHRPDAAAAPKMPPPGNVDRVTGLVDVAAVWFLDFDLVLADSVAVRSGEELAYLLRLGAKRAGFVVAVNAKRPYGDFFDAAMEYDLESFADCHIPEHQLGNPGLWTGEPSLWKVYRPWCWPSIPAAVRHVDALAAHLESSSDDPLRQVLRLSDVRLPQSAEEWLPDENVTVEQLRAGLTKGDEERWRLGLRRADRLPDGDGPAALRFVASRLRLWANNCVLPGRDIVVDAPRLLTWLPGVIGQRQSALSDWQVATALDGGAEWVSADAAMRLAPHRWDVPGLLDRPAWFWDRVRNDPWLSAHCDPFAEGIGVPESEPTFCENVSGFVRRDLARRFFPSARADRNRSPLYLVPELTTELRADLGIRSRSDPESTRLPEPIPKSALLD